MAQNWEIFKKTGTSFKHIFDWNSLVINSYVEVLVSWMIHNNKKLSANNLTLDTLSTYVSLL